MLKDWSIKKGQPLKLSPYRNSKKSDYLLSNHNLPPIAPWIPNSGKFTLPPPNPIPSLGAISKKSSISGSAPKGKI